MQIHLHMENLAMTGGWDLCEGGPLLRKEASTPVDRLFHCSNRMCMILRGNMEMQA